MSLFEDYSKGAMVLSREAAQASLQSLTVNHPRIVNIDREQVLVLTRDCCRDFVAEYLDTDDITYNAPFPVCHDYAEIAFGQFLLAAYKQGFPAAVSCFQTSITQQQGRHKLLAFLVVLDDGSFAVDYLQAQGGAWVTEADLKAVSEDEVEA